MKTIWKFAVTAALAIMVSAIAIAEERPSQEHPAPNSAVLFGFASVSDLPTLAEETCSHYDVPSVDTSATQTKLLTEDEEVKLADGVNKSCRKDWRRSCL